jgi:pSer/pThr/pTyr-binding forkhead associated (FHA) protein
MIVKLTVIQGSPSGQVLRFGHGDYFFGRGPECHIRFNTDWVSRQHCCLRVLADQAILRDLGSRHGTLVNGILRGNEHTLEEGDQIQIGPAVFEVSLEAGPGAPGVVITMVLPDDNKAPEAGPLDSTAQFPRFADPE